MSKKPSKIIGDKFFDNRGSVSFINKFNFPNIKRFYILENYDINYIRAWHAHRKEEKFFTCVSGSCQISCVQVKNFKQPNKKSKIYSWVLTAEKPEIIYVPKSYANGTMNLSHGTKILVFSTSTLKNSLQDDFRYDHKYWDPWEIKKR